MSEADGQGPGDRPPGPLSETFPEFVKYARNRQKTRSTRPLAHGPPPPRKETTLRQALLAGGAVVFVFLLWVGWHELELLRAKRELPGEAGGAKFTPSAWVDLPRPAKIGEVPEAWGGVHLGERAADVDPARTKAYAGKDHWADVLYTPPAKPGVYFGLSYHHERLYRIAVRYGESSTHWLGFYLMPAAAAYGSQRGYEYAAARPHVVTIFQTESRALRLDSVKLEEGAALSEVVLVDLEAGAARELERARGTRP